MSRTITALFDTRADAEAGGERLRLAGVDAANIHVHDKSTHTTTGDYSTREDRGLWGSTKNAFVPDEDRHSYEEGIRRGGVVLTADIDDDKTAAAVAALEEADTIDIDARTAAWRAEGWDYQAPTEAYAAEADGIDPYGTRDPAYSSGRYRSYVVDRA